MGLSLLEKWLAIVSWREFFVPEPEWYCYAIAAHYLTAATVTRACTFADTRACTPLHMRAHIPNMHLTHNVRVPVHVHVMI